MEKIEKYVVFQYEDEFGFHYMVMDKLPGEGPTYMEPILFGKKINPNCTPGAITQQPFSEDGKSAYALNSKFVPTAGWWPDKGRRSGVAGKGQGLQSPQGTGEERRRHQARESH